MEELNLSAYIRRLRMIYCREQQLIDLLPDLVSEAMRHALKESLAGYLAAARCRRYMIKNLAWDQGFSPLGDECLAMRKMIAVGISRLAREERGEGHDRAVGAFCHEVHRVIMVDYRLTRLLAMEQGLDADIGCFDDVIECMTAAFPEPHGQRAAFPAERLPAPPADRANAVGSYLNHERLQALSDLTGNERAIARLHFQSPH